MTNDKKTSLNISEFLNFVTNAKIQYDIAYEEMKTQEKLTQDYLHSLELDSLNYSDRSKLATKLATNRKDRRYYKDRVEEFGPIVKFFEEPQNKAVLNKLKYILGETRKAESYHQDRTYTPKVLSTPEMANEGFNV